MVDRLVAEKVGYLAAWLVCRMVDLGCWWVLMTVALMDSSMAALLAASLVESKAGSWAVHSAGYLAGLLAVWMAET